MAARYLRTSEIAQQVGVHPNTVRLYEEWGFLPPIPRSRGGYRQFTPRHLEQMRLAYLALKWPYPGGKEIVVELVKSAAQGDLGRAMEAAYRYLMNVRIERTHAESAVEFLELWARGQTLDTTGRALHIGEAADRLGVTIDMLRNWERNGLLSVPRDPENGYRLYGTAELSRLRVIRMLRKAGYSLMAILRMLLQFDRGQTDDLREALDTPRPDEEIFTAADRWLTTLHKEEERAKAIIQQVASMIAQPPAGR